MPEMILVGITNTEDSNFHKAGCGGDKGGGFEGSGGEVAKAVVCCQSFGKTANDQRLPTNDRFLLTMDPSQSEPRSFPHGPQSSSEISRYR